MNGGILSVTASAGVFYPLFVFLLLAWLGVRAGIRRRWGPDTWASRVRGLEQLSLTVLILGMLAFAMLQILLRNLFQSGLIWIEPLLRHLVLWIGFLSAVVATGRLRHIHMDVLARLLPIGPRVAILRFTTLVAAAVCVVLARAAWIFLGEELAFGSTGFLEIPVWLLTSVIFIGFSLSAARFASRAFESSAVLAALSRASEVDQDELGGEAP